MKTITTTLLSLMLLFTGYTNAQQQITNSGFESWDTLGDYTQPSNWFSLNPLTAFGYDPSTTLTSDAHSGNYAVQLESTAGQFSDISGVLCTGPILNAGLQPDFTKMKVAFSSKPQALEVYYKAFPQVNDTCVIAMYLTRWNIALQKTDTVARAGFEFKDSVGVYTLASCPFEYYLPVQPDSMFIIASSSIDGFNPTVGSKLILDDFHLTYPTTGLSENDKVGFAVYPNPVQTDLTIKTTGQGVLSVYSVSGALVLQQTINQLNESITVTSWAEGLYILVFQTNEGAIVSQKIRVQH